MDFETRAIHVGQEPDPATGAVTTPIYQTSTYAQEAVGVHKGYDYARVANPTRTALEECLASLESAEHGLAFSSGLGATTTIMHLVDPGDRVVCVNDVYGGMYRMFSQVYEPKGYGFDYVTPDEVSTNLAAHLDERTRIVWIESPTNPLLNVVDIRGRGRRRARRRRAARRRQHVRDAVPAAAARARRRHRRPLDDEVPRRPLRRRRRLRRHERPDDRGAPALPAEVARRRARAVRRLARAARPEDARRPDATALRERARASSRSSTSIRGVERRALPRACPTIPATRSPPARCATSAAWSRSSLESEEEAVELVARTKVWTLAESLGGVESLIEHPCRMTHASTADGPFASPRNLVRLSVGIESADDLVADLDRRRSLRPARA